jgi:hypothetical protein
VRLPFAVGLLIAGGLSAASAQSRGYDLTRNPAAALDDAFTEVTGVRELPGNRAIVVDRAEKNISLVDFAKHSSQKVGREGGGPGEYQLPAGIFPGPNNTTYIPDPLLAKVHVVSPEGKIVSALLPDVSGGQGALIFPRAVDASGRLYYTGNPIFRNTNGPVNLDSLPLMRWDPPSKRVDTIGWIPTGGTVRASGGAGRSTFSMRVTPFSPAPAWVAMPDGRVAIVRPDPYRVDFLGAGGQIARGPAIPFTPVKVGGAERDAFRKSLASSKPMMIVRGSGGTSVAPPAAFAPPEVKDEDFPATEPPFAASNVLVSPQGEIWVGRNRPANDPVPTYDIFDATGHLIGHAKLKPNSSVVGFGDGTIYVARTDPDDDLRYLEKYDRATVGTSG